MRLSPICNDTAISGCLARNAPISAGSTYSPGMLEPPTISSPLSRPWN
jgi:hypothetical protein